MTSDGVSDSVCIIGAGAAGVAVATGLRRRSFGGQITIIDTETEEPYDRPPLSKQVLAGAWEPQRTRLLSERRRAGLGANWRLGVRAVSLDSERRVVTLASGEALSYGRLAIATGVTPRLLGGPSLSSVRVLRTLGDALHLRRVVTADSRVVVIGAGFLGLEVAATARTLGAAVTVIEPVERPLASRLGEVVADRLLAVHRGRGVRVLTGTGVKNVHRAPSRLGCQRAGSTTVVLDDGNRLECDVVVVAIGCAPALEWLEDSGLDLTDGIVCDECCSAAARVWAAGDVARWFHPGLGRHVRFEHRLNAAELGDAVAGNILGERRTCAPVPFFWTDHFNVKIQMFGEIPTGQRGKIVEGDPDGESFVMVFRDSGDTATIGAVGWNAVKRMARYRAEIEVAWRARTR